MISGEALDLSVCRRVLLLGHQVIYVTTIHGSEGALLAVLRPTLPTITAISTLLRQQAKDGLLILEHLASQVGLRVLRDQLLG